MLRVNRSFGLMCGTVRQVGLRLQEDALTRNGQREGEEMVPPDVIQRMAERMEVPDPVNCGWQQDTLVLPSDTLPAGNAVEVKALS